MPTITGRARQTAKVASLGALVVGAAIAGFQFAIALVIAGLIFAPLERWRPLRPEQQSLRPDLATDLAHLVATLPTGALGALGPVFLLNRIALFDDGLIPSISARPILALGIGFLVAELVAYWSHRALHQVPLLWKFHQVHHSIESMDWIAGVRIHPVGVLLSAAARGAPLAVLGVDPALTGLFGGFTALANAFTHANLALPVRLDRWLVTPQFHHWHHATDSDAIDTNFSAILSFWDRLFGTYFMPDGRRPTAFGIAGVETPRSWWGQIVLPFRS